MAVLATFVSMFGMNLMYSALRVDARWSGRSPDSYMRFAIQ